MGTFVDPSPVKRLAGNEYVWAPFFVKPKTCTPPAQPTKVNENGLTRGMRRLGKSVRRVSSTLVPGRPWGSLEPRERTVPTLQGKKAQDKPAPILTHLVRYESLPHPELLPSDHLRVAVGSHDTDVHVSRGVQGPVSV